MHDRLLGRRDFLQGSLATVGLSLLPGCGLLPQNPASSAKIPRIGCLTLGGPSSHFDEHFRRGMADLGYVEGRNIAIEWRGDEGRDERLSENVAQLLTLDLDVIVATGEGRARAIRSATSTIPIVLSAGVDPIGAGLIESFNRPGGNVTGTIESHSQLHGKQLQLLHDMAPGITHVTVIGSGGAGASGARYDELQVTAGVLGLELRRVRVSTAEALAGALAQDASERTEALFAFHSGFISGQQQQIFEYASRRRLPAMYGNRLYAEAGGLAAYGPDLLEIHYNTAAYVDKILKGAHPGELSVRLPTTFDLVINLGTAQALGLTVPPSVLAQATELIQ